MTNVVKKIVITYSDGKEDTFDTILESSLSMEIISIQELTDGSARL
jgi:hypothetical protein